MLIKRLKEKIKSNRLLYNTLRKLKMFYFRVIKQKTIGSFFRILKIKNNKIVVNNFNGKGYGDNPKFIVNEFLKKDNNLDIVWILSKENMNCELPKDIRKVKHGTYKHLYELATAKIWIDNVRKYFWPIKRKKQFYIQTWHGGIALKRIEKDVEDKLDKYYVDYAKKDSKNIDLLVSNSKWETELYRKSFWYNGKIIEFGLPRNDLLIKKEFHKEIKENVKKALNIAETTKILLYAPTFRKSMNTNVYDLDYKKICNALSKKTNEKWVCLLRLHPNFSNEANNTNDENVINVSQYADITELLIASDCLITDYSSVSFEFAYQLKPVFLYANDYEEYVQDRGFYFDYFNLPFKASRDQKELLNDIECFEYDEYKNKLEDFYKDVGLQETGRAAEIIADEIIKEVKKNG